MVVIVHPTSSGSSPKNLEQIVDVKTVQDSRKNLSLANAVADTKNGREETIPTNISILEPIDEDEEPDEDLGETGLEELTEQKRMRDKIKCLGHISLTSKNF